MAGRRPAHSSWCLWDFGHPGSSLGASPWAHRLIRKIYKLSSSMDGDGRHPPTSLENLAASTFRRSRARSSRGTSPIVISPCREHRAGEQPKRILGHPGGHAAVKSRAICKPGSSCINLWAGSGAFLPRGRREHQAGGHPKASLDIVGDTLQSRQGRSVNFPQPNWWVLTSFPRGHR